jgi:hypothetical protein
LDRRSPQISLAVYRDEAPDLPDPRAEVGGRSFENDDWRALPCRRSRKRLGSHPKPLHPNAVRVGNKRGIDISGNRVKHVDEFVAQRNS